jgi:hypothetical protein
MTETDPAPEPDAAALIGEARELSAGLVAFLFNQLHAAPASALGPRMLRTFLRTVIKPCEALIRRAIYLLAARLAPLARSAPRARSSAKPPAPQRHPQPDAPRVPAFRLTEPTGPARTPGLPLIKQPRISSFGEAPPTRPAPRVSPDVFNQRFVLRLAALRAACADPDQCARRLLRRLARKRPAARPLKPAPPPGIKAARMDRLRTLFAELETATSRVWPRLADTS